MSQNYGERVRSDGMKSYLSALHISVILSGMVRLVESSFCFTFCFFRLTNISKEKVKKNSKAQKFKKNI